MKIEKVCKAVYPVSGTRLVPHLFSLLTSEKHDVIVEKKESGTDPAFHSDARCRISSRIKSMSGNAFIKLIFLTDLFFLKISLPQPDIYGRSYAVA